MIKPIILNLQAVQRSLIEYFISSSSLKNKSTDVKHHSKYSIQNKQLKQKNTKIKSIFPVMSVIKDFEFTYLIKDTEKRIVRYLD